MSADAIPKQGSRWDERRNTSRVFPVPPGALADALKALADWREREPAHAAWLAAGAPPLPKCRDCGGPQPRVVSRGDAHEWLCASCEYKRLHPDAAPIVPLPRERRPKALQKERLFGG